MLRQLQHRAINDAVPRPVSQRVFDSCRQSVRSTAAVVLLVLAFCHACSTASADDSELDTDSWAGYIAPEQLGGFSSISARWVVPAISCTTNDYQRFAMWIGFNGVQPTMRYTDGRIVSFGGGYLSLMQIGTIASCDHGVLSGSDSYDKQQALACNYGFYSNLPVDPDLCSQGVTYHGWWQASSFQPMTLLMNPMDAGDTVEATISRIDNGFLFTLADRTKGWVENRVLSSDVAVSTAEVIAESGFLNPAAITSRGGLYTAMPALDDSRTAFNNVSLNGKSLSDFYSVPVVNRTQSGDLIPGDLDNSTGSFSVVQIAKAH